MTRPRGPRRDGPGRGPPRAYTLVESMVVLVTMGVLVALAVPRFGRALESARLDVAGANLRAIWTAERIYWLRNRSYAADLAELSDLLDPSINVGDPAAPGAFYSYSVVAADSSSFAATAVRINGGSWAGALTITQDGKVTGVLAKGGEPDIRVGFE
ncbi:hypothetical protein OJF2_44120 [Aquisphaera giovannonii]|uniref:Prepilin-type N-terminal cleavage/methylation domain-containing protein n=1 Tax=Aquisphaera giovannonii TaxID=406548 RepID=A0A5B9W6Z5_9BACT|nr:hypothetical protein [Aquisphaera giovannonii]QEH35855.1 hypothetical protein OJF2_44120 [Aquisphaera giovannonii]